MTDAEVYHSEHHCSTYNDEVSCLIGHQTDSDI